MLKLPHIQDLPLVMLFVGQQDVDRQLLTNLESVATRHIGNALFVWAR